MLRQWERLSITTRKGLDLCSSMTESDSSVSIDWFETSFRTYRKVARAEISVEMDLEWSAAAEDDDDKDSDDDDGFLLDGRDARKPRKYDHPLIDFKARCRHTLIKQGYEPDKFVEGVGGSNSNVFQDAALNGDARLMEMLVGLGSAVDYRFRNVNEFTGQLVFQPTASALVMLCSILAVGDSTKPEWERARVCYPQKPDTYDRLTECAMQLVRLGADLNRRLELTVCTDSDRYNVPDLHGKTAFQMAAMSKRRPLVALMLEHMRLSPEERAEVVHCRCGSRLPWKQCHSTGAGQPPHYIINEGRTHYRVSPLARCPCNNTNKTYYKCCWSDNRYPSYIDDRTGFHYGAEPNLTVSTLMRMAATLDPSDPHQSFVMQKAFKLRVTMTKNCISRIREPSPTHFLQMCSKAGPKSKLATWDRFVYAGVAERLEIPFLWTDVHHELDRSELLRRSEEWNVALQKYCDDAHLVGEERDRVITTHTANPCGPCGNASCEAFESSAREFERCSRCKTVAYCGRACQKKDWADHEKKCTSGVTIFSMSRAEQREWITRDTTRSLDEGVLEIMTRETRRRCDEAKSSKDTSKKKRK